MTRPILTALLVRNGNYLVEDLVCTVTASVQLRDLLKELIEPDKKNVVLSTQLMEILVPELVALQTKCCSLHGHLQTFKIVLL